MNSGLLLWPALVAAILLTSCATRVSTGVQSQYASHWWSARAQQTVESAGTNRAELVGALQRVPQPQRVAMQFLVENMPARDAATLRAGYLLTNVALAHQAFSQAPWRDRVPKEIFLNDVLPYACMNEGRDAWREKLRVISVPLVADCKTPGEAAHRLNQKLFPLLKVRYSTERKRADQGPTESIASGIATCTGLSILLVDACRSVGVPARVVGTPLWTNLRGNHTWVEVWDGGWHFAGATEPDAKGLDRGWFVHDAAQAKRDVPQHAIYATSFKPTGLSFPLVWAPEIKWVPAVNVTECYTPKAVPTPSNQVRLLVKVLDAPAGQRVAAKVTLTETNAVSGQRGMSKDESADLNDLLVFPVQPARTLHLTATLGAVTMSRDLIVGTNAQELVTLTMTDTLSSALRSIACYAPLSISSTLITDGAAQLQPVPGTFYVASAERTTSGLLTPALAKPSHAHAPADWKFPCPTNEIAHYTALRVKEKILIDGKLDERAWQTAPTSPRYVDILSGQPTLYDTRATVLWDDDNLYIGVRVEEPQVHAKYQKHNDPIYYDNDVEVFIAGRDAYYEFEINAFNTTYEVFFIWDDAYEPSGFAKAPEFARSKLKPFNGVGFTIHPRGGRLGNFDWSFPGMKSAVHIDGTVNDDRDTDRGWTVELAFPWQSMKWLATDGRALPPKDGDVWRIDFSRFNTYKAPPPAKDSGGWVWTRHGVWDSHLPECFAFLHFTTNSPPAR